MKEWFYNRYKAFLTWMGDIYLAHEPPACKAHNIEKAQELIRAGDIICRGYIYYLDGYFIPGDFSHSGVVINAREMVHSIAEDAQSIHPIDFVKDADRFRILRPRYKSEGDITKVVDRAIWHVDLNKTEYDFTFKDDSKFYCHELTVDCVSQAGIKVDSTHKVFGVWPFRFKRDIYLAQNLIDACDTLYIFNPAKGAN